MNDYEVKLKENQKRNEKFIDEFKSWLKEKGLVDKTIKNHISNIELYINDYLNYEEVTEMEKGCGMEINLFLGDWFIRKCMWSSASSIKSTCSSVKKFYQCMLEKGHVRKEAYDDLCEVIKENKEDWLMDCKAYDDGDFESFYGGIF